MKELVSFKEGLQITPNHPIRKNGVWMRPRELQTGEDSRVESSLVFNLVLDRGHILVVNGVDCVTWGHGFKGKDIEHSFYGTRAVVDALSELAGFEDGFVTITDRNWRGKTNLSISASSFADSELVRF
jgi:hypothetical protein